MASLSQFLFITVILKSCLHLTNEFQLRSSDAITAHTAIVLTRYIFLSLKNREDKDERTMGALFMVICDELEDILVTHSFGLIMNTFVHCLDDFFHLNHLQANDLVTIFLAHLSPCAKERLTFSVYESE